MTTTPTTSKAKGGLALIAVATACALACSLQLIIGAGIFASVGAVATRTPWVAGALFAVTATAALAWWVRRRRRAAAVTTCGCGGGC